MQPKLALNLHHKKGEREKKKGRESRRSSGGSIHAKDGCLTQDDTHLMLDLRILQTRRTPEQRIDILERQIRSLRNPIGSPDISRETR